MPGEKFSEAISDFCCRFDNHQFYNDSDVEYHYIVLEKFAAELNDKGYNTKVIKPAGEYHFWA